MVKSVLVYGMGKSAKSAASMLVELGFSVAVYDDADGFGEGFCGCEDRRGLSPEAVIEGVGTVVISPSVPLDAPVLKAARKNGVEIIGELELGYRYCRSDVIAVTGTNGKTTTTMMLSKILSDCGVKNLALGNIGEPFCAHALQMCADEVAVLEVSSFQLESIEYFRPKIAICLNVTPDHLERHGSFVAYIRAKRAIFDNMTSDDFAIVNYDDEVTQGFAGEIACNTYFFSVENEVRGVFLKDGDVWFSDGEKRRICRVRALGELNPHNLQNALACMCAAAVLGMPDDSVVKSISSFRPPRHRLELVGKVGGANVYNDSKSTNTDSALKACRAMYGSVCLIAGGYDKGLDTDELLFSLPRNVRKVVCFGANADKLLTSAARAGVPAERAEGLENAVDRALISDAANVLFSPATSSFDMFSDFEERGDAFVRIVKERICAQNDGD